MNAATILAASIVLFAIAYRFYSPWIERRLGVEAGRRTPAHTMRDDVDYCPARMPVLFGHHFASIAGAAPIVGPIVAAAYGWLPVILWIVIGGIFMGSVHDFASLVASIRHSGRSIGEVIADHVGRTGGKIFLVFLFAALVLLIAVFLVIVAKTFAEVPSAATASMLFIALAVLFGIAVYRLRFPIWLSTIVGVALLASCMLAGWAWPIRLSETTWALLLLAYCFISSVTPVWILLQPRDYLNSFLLYALAAGVVAGIFVAQPELKLPAFASWSDPGIGPLFPMLFVTVACGAISGFHSIVASGTTAKQLDREKDARPIGYGAMLVECLVAVAALIAAARLATSDYASTLASQGPVALFSAGTGEMLSKLGIKASSGAQFAALAVSAFVMTTLDTATRLCRFAFQEFFAPRRGKKPGILSKNRYIATAATIACAATLALSGSWKAIWPIFGASNQLLAALALLAVSIWLKSKGKKTRFLEIPMVAMFVITLSALGSIVWTNYAKANYTISAIGAALFALAALLVIESVKSIRRTMESR
ncbi:MAG: carbon starvation protein A [bacterium]